MLRFHLTLCLKPVPSWTLSYIRESVFFYPKGKKAGLEIGYEVGEVIEAKGDFRKNPVYSAGIVELE